MGSLLEIVSPMDRGRRYGIVSAAFLFVVVLAEIEGLAFLAFALVAGRPDMFLPAQSALFPAAWLVSAGTAGGVLWRARNWAQLRRRPSADAGEGEDVAESFRSSNWRQRIGSA